MSWFDEAVARRLREQRQHAAASSSPLNNAGDVLEPLGRQRQEVELCDPLIQRLLGEYGEHAYGKSVFQKRFLIRLERPGKNAQRAWNWHWHLYSLLSGKESLELHPTFAADGLIVGFTLISGRKRVEIVGIDETVIQEGLVSLYLQ